MQLGKKSEEQHRQCRERQQLFERKTELGLGANLDFLGNCPSSHQCSTLYLCCCCQEKWTDHRLNLLRWENFKVEKIPLGMIETCFDNGVKGTIPTAIVLLCKNPSIYNGTNNLLTKSLMFQVLSFFHKILQNSLQKPFQFMFFYKITKIK